MAAPGQFLQYPKGIVAPQKAVFSLEDQARLNSSTAEQVEPGSGVYGARIGVGWTPLTLGTEGYTWVSSLATDTVTIDRGQ